MMNISQLIDLKIPVVLASKSPRRSHLLKTLGFDFEVITSDLDEDIDANLPPEKYCTHLAQIKAEHVADILVNESLVIGADTIVVLNGKILNKPDNSVQAIQFLKALSGNTHKVFTGIAIVNSANKNIIIDYQVTEVTFRQIDDFEIDAYVQTGSPLDKAGAYGIQDDFGAVFVSHINGCYYNIVGLPIELLYSSIRKFLSMPQ